MCLFLSVLLLGPRFGILLWWIVEPSRWDSAFNTFIYPALGFIVLPWTTLTFVVVAPHGNVDSWDWIWLVFAFSADLISMGMGGYRSRGGPVIYA